MTNNTRTKKTPAAKKAVTVALPKKKTARKAPASGKGRKAKGAENIQHPTPNIERPISGAGPTGSSAESMISLTTGDTTSGSGILWPSITPTLHSASPPPPAFLSRAGQQAFERDVRAHRVCGLLARRRYGKTTIAARIALFKMLKTAGHTVVFGSVKVDLGRDMVREESRQLQQAFHALAQQAQLTLAEAGGRDLPAGLSADDFAELYEATRLEFRLWHSRSIYSRTLIVALTPDAVGLGGDLILDEVGRARRFHEVLEAVMPIIQDQPTYRCIYTTTPPPDDAHPSFALLAPPIGIELPVRPEGNTYRSELGIHVRRITVHDACADGIPLYDEDQGLPITPEESRRLAHDKDAWDRNYGCHFVLGGTSACGLLELDNAQRKGVGQGFCEVIRDDVSFDAALERLGPLLGDGPVGAGWDLASTEKETSNPSSFTLMERVGSEYVTRAALLWKSASPAVQLDRARRLLATVAQRPAGGRLRRLAIDATGDRLFARSLQTELAREGVPVELVIASETVTLPGYDSAVTKKTWLGDLYLGALHDNRHTFPPERYFREDHRLPKKMRGGYVCEPAANGMHADTFDSGKLAQHALQHSGGALTAETLDGIRTSAVSGTFGSANTSSAMAPHFLPRQLGGFSGRSTF